MKSDIFFQFVIELYFIFTNLTISQTRNVTQLIIAKLVVFYRII